VETPATSVVAGVAVLLDEHWDALDVDFRRHYGLDLEEVCFGPNEFGVRRLYAYISRLPPDSALARELGWSSWDQTHELIATLIEVEINAKRTQDTDPIFRYPRPIGLADEDEPDEPMTVESIRAALLQRG
jgi:hypothetical protein